MIRATSLAAIALALVLPACGQKGPLKLPESAKPVEPAEPGKAKEPPRTVEPVK
jgi:predicted small lipoprotein YifL